MAASIAVSRPRALPWHIVAVLFAATSVIVGVIWDISWHRTIGRDTFWTPAHLAIYLGGIVAGLACGWLVLRTTFAGRPEQRAAGVRFWGFRGPLGAWVCIWGAIAMITSAPFDDWWHNAYGLDVRVLSPPHVVLAVGMNVVACGALALAIAARNRADRTWETLTSTSSDAGRSSWNALAVYASGVVVTLMALFIIEFTFPL